MPSYSNSIGDTRTKAERDVAKTFERMGVRYDPARFRNTFSTEEWAQYERMRRAREAFNEQIGYGKANLLKEHGSKQAAIEAIAREGDKLTQQTKDVIAANHPPLTPDLTDERIRKAQAAEMYRLLSGGSRRASFSSGGYYTPLVSSLGRAR